jgi:transposase-like protein
MQKSRFSEQQIALALQQVEQGASVPEACRKLGIAEQTYYRWKKKFGEMAPSEIKKRVNHKRGYRLYREEELTVRVKRRKKLASHARVRPPAAAERRMPELPLVRKC